MPNAVKYFDQWAKAVIAKQRLEKPETPIASGKPHGAQAEKSHSKTQILDEAHLAARSAALMVNVTSETQYNRFQTKVEGQGAIESGWDLAKRVLKLGDNSETTERDFANQRGLVQQLIKAAKNENLTQFENLYKQCTGKQYNPADFKLAYKKPEKLAFPDLAEMYEKSQKEGLKGAKLVGAAGLAASAFVPGVGVVTGPLAVQMAAGAGLAVIGSGLVEYSNSGKIDQQLLDGAPEAAIVGASVPVAISVGLVGEGLAGNVAIKTAAQGATTVAKAGLLGEVATATAGGMSGGAAAGGMIGGGHAIIEDTKKGKFDPGHVAFKTAEGSVYGAVIGAPLGAGGALLKNVRHVSAAEVEAQARADAIASEVAAGARAGAATETAPLVSSEVATTKDLAQAFNKTAELPPQIPSKAQAQQPTDIAKPTQTDLSKVTQPTDVTKGAQGDATKGSPPTQVDASKGTPSIKDDVSKTSTGQQDRTKSTVDDTEKWQKGSTQDLTEQIKLPPSQFTRNVEAWNKKIGGLKNDPTLKNVETGELDGGQISVKYERANGSKVEESFNLKDGSKKTAEITQEPNGRLYRKTTSIGADGKYESCVFRQMKNAAGEDVWSPTNLSWEKHLNNLRNHKGISNLEEIPIDDKWTGVNYRTSKGGVTVEERIRISDGAKRTVEEGIGTDGTPWRRSTTTADGKTILTQSEWIEEKGWVRGKPQMVEGEAPGNPLEPSPQGHKWAQEWEKVGNKWLDDRLKALDAQGIKANKTELESGWKSLEYTDASGAKVTEAFNPVKGSTHTIRNYKVKDQSFQDDTLELPKDGLTLWQKRKAVESNASKKAREFDEELKPQLEWVTEETKRTTITTSGKKRIDTSHADDGHRVRTTEE